MLIFEQKAMRPNLGLMHFNCLNEGLGFPKLGASTIIPGKCNIPSTFEKNSCALIFKYTFLNLHLKFSHLEILGNY